MDTAAYDRKFVIFVYPPYNSIFLNFISNSNSHNQIFYFISEFLKLLPLQNEIHQIQTQQSLILYLLVLLLIITCLHYTWVCLKWLRHKRYVQHALKKLKLKKDPLPPTAHLNGGGGGTTIQNMCVINDIERSPSQIYSMTGKREWERESNWCWTSIDFEKST